MFVVEDGDGLCGFAVATSDSKHFYEQFKKHWLPEVCTCMSKKIIHFTEVVEHWRTSSVAIKPSFGKTKIRWNLLKERSTGPDSFNYPITEGKITCNSLYPWLKQ